MGTRPLQLVTIVCEVLIEERLIRDLKRLGMVGYTRTGARGEGRRGVHDEWEGNNARIEALVVPDVAARILAHLEETYLPHYPVVAWVVDVAALIADRHIATP